MKQPINIGNFTLTVSLCGEYWVAPGSVYISTLPKAERVARYYARRMRG